MLMTAEIDGVLYGAINTKQLSNTDGFSAAVKVDFVQFSVEQKKQHWRNNWCYPIVIKTLTESR
jgi:hypothetical protein